MARGKAEDAGGLTPAKDGNAAPYHFAPRTLPIFMCVDYIIPSAPEKSRTAGPEPQKLVAYGGKYGIITARKPEPLIFQGFRLFLLLTCYKFNIKPHTIKVFFVSIQGRF